MAMSPLNRGLVRGVAYRPTGAEAIQLKPIGTQKLPQIVAEAAVINSEVRITLRRVPALVPASEVDRESPEKHECSC
jgi:hypothetical protein